MKKFLKDDSGATSIEYGLLAAILGVAIVGAGSAFRTGVQASYNNLGAKFKSYTDTAW